jgi:hypothetical protein
MREELLKICGSRPIVGIPRWIKAARPQLFEKIQEETRDYPTKNFMEQVYIIINGAPPKCKCGNYRVFNTFILGYRIGCVLGNACLDVSENRTEKQKITLLRKFGVSNAAKLEIVQQKIKETNLQKYGTAHHSQNALVKEKSRLTRNSRTPEQKEKTKERARNTNLKKYDVPHHMNMKAQQQKLINTNLLKYGVEFPLQNPVSLAKMKTSWEKNDIAQVNSNRKQTLIEKYGVDAASKISLPESTIKILASAHDFRAFVEGKERKQVMDTLKIHEHTLYLYAKKYDARHLFKRPLTSQFEIEVANFLTTLEVDFIQNNRAVIAPLELDFYIPMSNLAIECCGLYWHSENSSGRNRNYHHTKYKKCADLGINLLTIFEDDWQNKKEKIQNRIKLSVEKSKTYVYARKTIVKEIDSPTAKYFTDEYHIQSSSPAKISLGLYHEDQLISVMTFNKARYNKKYDYEIVRYCSNKNIVGGSSKLLKFFVDKYSPKNIISYNDNRYFTGKVYETLGFTQQKTNVGYCYTDYKKRFDRLNFQKHKLVEQGHDNSKSEWNIMQELGFDRIWDCGQTTWALHLRD